MKEFIGNYLENGIYEYIEENESYKVINIINLKSILHLNVQILNNGYLGDYYGSFFITTNQGNNHSVQFKTKEETDRFLSCVKNYMQFKS